MAVGVGAGVTAGVTEGGITEEVTEGVGAGVAVKRSVSVEKNNLPSGVTLHLCSVYVSWFPPPPAPPPSP